MATIVDYQQDCSIVFYIFYSVFLRDMLLWLRLSRDFEHAHFSLLELQSSCRATSWQKYRKYCCIIISRPLRSIFPKIYRKLSALPEVRGTADTDGGAYSPFRSILLVLTHDFIIIQLYGPACGDG